MLKLLSTVSLTLVFIMFSLVANAKTGLEGDWVTECVTMPAVSPDSNPYGQIRSAHFDDDIYREISWSYEIDCPGDATNINEIVYSYSIDGNLADQANFNLVFSHLYITSHAPIIIYVFNLSSFCGYSDWTVGKPKDVIGRQCGDTRMPAAGDPRYDIIHQLDSTLRLGRLDEYYNGLSEARRPQELDSEFIYTRSEQ